MPSPETVMDTEAFSISLSELLLTSVFKVGNELSLSLILGYCLCL